MRADSSPGAEPPPSSLPGPLWRDGPFARFWSAQAISLIGTQISFIGLPLIAVTILDASAIEVAVLGASQFLPYILVGLVIGGWVDRLPRRPILIAADVGRAVLLFSVPAASAIDALSLAQLYLVSFSVGTLGVFADVAEQSFLPALVGRRALVTANGHLEVARATGRLAGPGLAGLLIDALRAPLAIAIDALTYLVSAALLASIRRREPRTTRHSGTDRTLLREIVGGLQHVARHPLLRPLASSSAVFNLGSSVVDALLVLYMARELSLSALEIGIIFGVGNAGLLPAALLSSRLSAALGIGRSLLAASLMMAAGVALVPLSSLGLPTVALAVGRALRAAGTVTWNVTSVSIRQSATPDAVLGRMTATFRAIAWGTIPLGLLAGGVLASGIGVVPALWIGAVVSAGATAVIAASEVRHLVGLPTAVTRVGGTGRVD